MVTQLQSLHLTYFAIEGQIFTCGHIASQRGESINSTIKENGAKKTELRKFNLFQFLDHLLTQFDRMQARALDLIQNLIKSKQS